MFRTFEADNTDSLWLEAAGWFAPGGEADQQESRFGATAEVLHVGLCLTDPRQRWAASRSPAMNPAFALAEVIWIMCGRNDSAMLNYFNPQLKNYAGDGSTYHGAYGHRLRKHFGIDQLDRAYWTLKGNSASRQVALQIWDSSADLPETDGLPRSKDIPCNVCSLLKVRNGRLEWTQIMRSNDIILGLPHNIVQFTSLQEIMAGWLELEAGCYHHFADSLHLYDRDTPVSARIDRQEIIRNEESIALPKDASDKAFSVLGEFCDQLASGIETVEIVKKYRSVDLVRPFKNWAAILCAEGLRRRRRLEEMEEVLGECTNRCLAAMFERWLARNTKNSSSGVHADPLRGTENRSSGK